MRADQRPRRKDDVTHHLDDDGVVALFDRAGLRLLVLDDVGSGVWVLADGTRTLEEIVDEVVASFAAPRAQVAEDVSAFFETLVAASLVDVT
jgi:hypothetical protein